MSVYGRILRASSSIWAAWVNPINYPHLYAACGGQKNNMEEKASEGKRRRQGDQMGEMKTLGRRAPASWHRKRIEGVAAGSIPPGARTCWASALAVVKMT